MPRFYWGVILVIVLALSLAFASFQNDSLIVDEIPHIGAGYSYLVKQDMRLNPEHPPLAKDLAAIPLLILKLTPSVFETKFWQEDVNGQWEFGRRLVYNSSHNADQITPWVKTPMLVFFALAIWLIAWWTKKLYGSTAGIIAIILFAFSPTAIAHARFVTTDLPALWGVLFASFFFLRFLEKPSRANLFWAGIWLGLALLTKFSTFLLLPFFVLLLTVKISLIKNFQSSILLSFKTILLVLIAIVVVIWPVYIFHTWNYPPAQQATDTAELLQSFGKRWLADPVVWAADKPILRALGHYGLGLLMVVQRSAGGNTTYFWGEVSRFGWKSYFPIVYFLKETLAWWSLVIIALLALIIKVKRVKLKAKSFGEWWQNHFTEGAMLLWLGIYWFTSIDSTLNIGARHLLPVFPFTIILISGRLAKVIQKAKIKKQNYHQKLRFLNFKWLFYILIFTIYTLLGWHIYENLRAFPYYLAYFNQTALLRPPWVDKEQAGYLPGGHNYVVDSNLDWGQDLKRLAQWVEKKGLPKIETDYFGWADPAYYLKDRYVWTSSSQYQNAQDFIERNQANGWLAVSATFLQGSQGPSDQPQNPNWLWLKNYRPVMVIGHSIFVYHL